jgi:sugar phosphate isomerase/epimerase
MELKFFCPRWGSEHLAFNAFLAKVKSSGYDGVEMSLPFDKAEKGSLLKAINGHGLLYMAQHWETTTVDFQDHKTEFRARRENLARANPVIINTQTGKDFFSFEQNAELIEIATQVSQKSGVKVVHEMHRGKFSFAAHVMAEYLSRLPDLRLGFDISHWCNVAESFLQDQKEAVDMAISRADHIHARVGFPEGPQIPDPRVPEWQEAVNIHLGWWKRIIERNKMEGKQVFTITPEFGPYPYMTILPYTQQAITNQWDVNVYMMNLLKASIDE